MDEHTRQRVFEPLDTNSLSLISSASSANLTGLKSNNNSFMGRRCKTPTTPTAGLPRSDENCNELLQWKLERKDFVFDSNSTPSKKRQSPFYEEGGQTLGCTVAPPPRKRRSQLIGAKPQPKGPPRPATSRLGMSASKLDLLEDDKITSLPFAPPQPQPQLHTTHSRESGDSSETLRPSKKRSRLNLVESIRVHNTQGQRYISYATPTPLMQEETQDDDEPNPLIMVEDYIAYADAHTHQARKRVSMSDLRSKLGQRTDDHIPIKPKKSTLPKVHEAVDIEDSRPIDELVQGIFHSGKGKPASEEYGDRYISTLGINSSVKHCVICERALYELRDEALVRDYKELVCENCTAEYERASRLFENYEFESSVECSGNSSSFLSDLETSMGTVEVVAVPTIRNPVSRLGGTNGSDHFSQDLIARLKRQAGCTNRTDATAPRSLTWFLAARDKLRQQWKASGILPFFMGSAQPSSE
ncbi:hypothetical protein DAKH74_038970 [Maudiozyma humilis]|uniref:Uncharacterized protein n=1 Tax=Maudiozyma humilis TaxID=51915 RepID=A0AAV5S2N3_MAUHU|nr:hypothetical protein DAKH74_038970 [Kazachstania humilis]